MANLVIRWFSTVYLVMTLIMLTSLSRAAPTDEYALKAIYIYNFAKFIEWPADSFDSMDSALNFCVLGEDPFGVAIDSISGRKVGNHILSIKIYPRVAVVSSCHILFISRSEHHRMELILNDIGRRPILTVSDIEVFSDHGGMLTLLTRNELVHFSVNPDAAELTGIKISSKLLELASVIVSSR